MAAAAKSPRRRLAARALGFLAVSGPGFLVMLADTDAGNIVTAAQGGAQWGYRLLPLVLALIPILYLLQEITVRLGIYTGRGFTELIRERFGAGWAWLSLAGLAAATMGSLVTELTGVAGVGELYGVSRSITLPLAAAALLAIVASGSYRRAERAGIAIGSFLLAFFAVLWAAHPNLNTMARQMADLPLTNRNFLFMTAAIIGMTLNPWMVFYQQSAIAEKKLQPGDYVAARWETAAGAVLTQLLSGAVLISVASLLLPKTRAMLTSVGEISGALTPVFGEQAGRAAFGLGVLGGSMAAALVSSLALAWGAGETIGHRRAQNSRPFETAWFHGAYAAAVATSAVLVWSEPDLVWLNIGAQVLNAFLLPLVIGLLLALGARALPEPLRLRGWRLWLIVGISTALCSAGFLGGLSGML
ncbi:MAG: divalent metal cation transporter [Methylocapsa sp.]|nr:divalent metal cation transporter [Methylocapsa sp.]